MIKHLKSYTISHLYLKWQDFIFLCDPHYIFYYTKRSTDHLHVYFGPRNLWESLGSSHCVSYTNIAAPQQAVYVRGFSATQTSGVPSKPRLVLSSLPDWKVCSKQSPQEANNRRDPRPNICQGRSVKQIFFIAIKILSQTPCSDPERNWISERCLSEESWCLILGFIVSEIHVRF